MNISQAERGGNGVSRRMVNQWLPARGIADCDPGDRKCDPGVADFRRQTRVKTKISKTTPCKVRISARNAALLRCCVRSRRPDVPGQHASVGAPDRSPAPLTASAALRAGRPVPGYRGCCLMRPIPRSGPAKADPIGVGPVLLAARQRHWFRDRCHNRSDLRSRDARRQRENA